MSELGNRIKDLRGDISQSAFAEKTGLSLRTISKIEAGEPVRLDTIQQIARSLRLSKTERQQLLISWVRLELGAEVQYLVIEPKGNADILQDAMSLPAKIQALVTEVPSNLQEELLRSLHHPEILRCLKPLNDLVDQITQKTNFDQPDKAAPVTRH
jgi:transcriptional regulator with XRE-family HTH domain